MQEDPPVLSDQDQVPENQTKETEKFNFPNVKKIEEKSASKSTKRSDFQEWTIIEENTESYCRGYDGAALPSPAILIASVEEETAIHPGNLPIMQLFF